MGNICAHGARDGTKVPFVELSIQLHSCVPRGELQDVLTELDIWLRKRFLPQFGSDVVVELDYSAGLNDPAFPPDTGEASEEDGGRYGQYLC